MTTFKAKTLTQIIDRWATTPLMPVLFTSHGNPMDIPLPPYGNPFLSYLGDLGKEIRDKYKVKAIVVVSAHWCTTGSYINISPWPKTVYDYYGFPDHYYTLKYPAPGAPNLANEIASKSSKIHPTEDWGFDHGNWPMLRHLFPEADIPVIQLSIDYYKSAQYHFDLGKQLRKYREKGVLIIGSGAVVHNLKLAGPKIFGGDMTLYGWDQEFDLWVKEKVDQRDIKSLIEYNKSKLGQLSAPTPDHYVPLLYSLAVMDQKDSIRHTYEGILPAFSERSFIMEHNNL